jgi:uncharacterized OB-fold protein
MSFRSAPALSDDNRHFWTGGADGMLHFLRCQDCGYYIHPPAPVCRVCRSTDVSVEAVAGSGTVISYTVNVQQWTQDITGPYTIIIVELDAQLGLNLTSNLVGCPPDDARIGMRVEVEFEQDGEIYYPLFHPAAEASVR